MGPLFATKPLPVTLQALARLGIHSTICQMLLLCHRYVFVFLDEIKRMFRAMRVRGFRPATNVATMASFGNFLGMLFVRSFDRTQRVHEAMLSRGYTGVFPSYVQFNMSGTDLAKGLLWICIGILLLFVDNTV